jgi:hypothetical protein
MANEQRHRLLLLVAELADERARVTRLLSELDHAARRLAEPWHSDVFRSTLGGETLQAIFDHIPTGRSEDGAGFGRVDSEGGRRDSGVRRTRPPVGRDLD